MTDYERHPSGLVRVPEKEYHSMDDISRSFAWAVCEHSLDRALDVSPISEEAAAEGRAAHTAVFESDLYFDRFAVAPDVDRRTKAGKAEWERFVIENAGKTVLKKNQHDLVMAMCSSVFANPGMYEALAATDGEAEGTAFAEINGVACRVRPDWYIPSTGMVYDLKTSAAEITYGAWRYSVRKYGYHFQAAFYTLVMQHAGLEVNGFVNMAVSKIPPHETAMYSFGDKTMQRQKGKVMRTLDYIREWQEGNVMWTGLRDGDRVVMMEV